MGFGMSLGAVISASRNWVYRDCYLSFRRNGFGNFTRELFKVEKNIALLISTGTAICGGSAIAAVAPILNSKNYQNSFASLWSLYSTQ
jgi:uncharacterized membrane protein YadS